MIETTFLIFGLILGSVCGYGVGRMHGAMISEREKLSLLRKP